MELRDIEILLTLAEELHFGRTAERLHLSQARVSQSISRQERRLGGALFDRNTRTVTLTPLGQRLCDDLRPGYGLIRRALAHAADTARGCSGTVRLGAMGALPAELAWLVEEFRARHPQCSVEFVEFHFSDSLARLRTGEVAAQLRWLPLPDPGLRLGPVVLTEGRVLAVAADSDLASRTRVSLEDLAGRTVPDPGTRAPREWLRAMCPERTPGGRLIHRGPPARTFHELLALVANGRVVCPLNAHVLRYYAYPGVVLIPLEDAPRTEWALVLPDSAPAPHVQAFIDTARELGPREMGGGGTRERLPDRTSAGRAG
ncbi:LysR family transcriptional regulator [Streptomyces longisporoflavus]|uniref:LysR family transcriptional regulator n=1 Tax=Streptomyces longisporoflavus TaxID=28044 RepID=UPI00167EB24B|nr:LysR family transcriptional regulator [Streptomyces longisporoflavus]GGV24924.1 LysR family transcriptional regulator [Streptomyces longisporoflavus]